MQQSTTLTTNTSTPALAVFGEGSIFATGAFAGGNVKLQLSADAGANWFDALDDSGTALALTVNGVLNFDVGNCLARGTLAGATPAAGTAQVETATCAGPAATTAGVSVSLLRNPSAGDVFRVHTDAATFLDFAFVVSGATGNQVNIGVDANASATALRAKLVAAGRPCTGATNVLILAANATGITGNNWSFGEFPVVEFSPFLTARTGAYTGGRDAGTLTATGIVTATVVGARVVGGTAVLSVGVEAGDTLNVWAEKIRQALIASPAVPYSIGGAAAAITLTKGAPFDGPDGTLNLALANGTPSPGITAAPSSANTTAGVATAPNVAINIVSR